MVKLQNYVLKAGPSLIVVLLEHGNNLLVTEGIPLDLG